MDDTVTGPKPLTNAEIPATRRDVLLLHSTITLVLALHLGWIGLVLLPLAFAMSWQANR